MRLIEIADFDLTPCGGTHARSTGEVGVIAVRSWERAKGLARIQFMAGIRVLADYRIANHTAREVAALFSAGREDSPALVAKIIEDNQKLTRRVSELEEVACRVEAEELLRNAEYGTGSGSDRSGVSTLSERVSSPTVREGLDDHRTRIIAKVFDDRNADSLKHLALALIAHPDTVALLGSRDGATARLVFARSSDATGDMNTLMRGACSIIGGRGGGRPDMAQGGGKNVAALDRAVQATAQGLIES